MNNQFATQFLREDTEDVSVEDLIASLRPLLDKAIEAGLGAEEIKDMITGAIDLNEDGGAAAAPAGGGGGSSTGGGVTNGASFTPGAGEQYAAGTRKKRVREATEGCIPVEDIARVMKDYRAGDISNLFLAMMDLGGKYGLKLAEDAPRLAGSPGKTTSQGAKNLSAYSSVGFTKAPSAEEAGKDIEGVQVKMLWKEGEGKKSLSPEAIKIIQDFTNRNISSHLRGDFKQEVAKGLKDFDSNSTVNDLKKFLEDKASFFLDLYREDLNESRAYSQFKKQTSTRSESERMHEAAKMINKRLEEISKLLEFTSQMKEELSEANETLEYKHNTKKVFEKINKKVVEVYSKSKKLG